MSWLLRRLFDLVDGLSRWYYQRKYGALAQRMGREQSSERGENAGFIIIQIDGLAHEFLVEAMGRGFTPTLQRLVHSGELRLSRYRCGLPSSTPAVQAGIMFGNNWDVPSFRWYEKDTAQSIVCKPPGLVRQIQERVAAGRQGILHGGSSYVNMFDGDARLSLFTLAAWGRERFFENVRGFGFLLLFLLNPFRVVRTVTVAVWEYGRDLWRRSVRRWRSGRTRGLDIVSPFLQIMVNVVFREIETFGVVLDIYRGVPSIWVNYFGYDELAHHVGPLGTDALRALRGLDGQIRQIDRIRRQYRRRDYDLFVLSDHGQSPSTPFQEIRGVSIGRYIADHLGEPVAVDEQTGSVYHARKPAVFLLEELKGMEAGRSPRTIRLLRSLRRWFEDRVPPDPELGWDWDRRSDVVVRCSGSLAHVYFNVTADVMDLSEMAVLYPELLSCLLREPSIGVILGRESGQPAMLGSSGIQVLGSDEQVEPSHPLTLLLEPRWGADQLARLATFPHSGDMILLGAWDADGRVVCFEEQWASHGGLGGPQDYPFLLHPPSVDWDVSDVENAEQLHALFVRRYGLGRDRKGTRASD